MRPILLFLAMCLPFSAVAQSVQPNPIVPEPPSLALPEAVAQDALTSVPETAVTALRPSVSGTSQELETAEIELDTATVENVAQTEAVTETLIETTPRSQLSQARYNAIEFLKEGGPSIWAISALSVVTVALILWKIWRLALIGAWSKGRAGKAVTFFEEDDLKNAHSVVAGRPGIRSKVVLAALDAIARLPEDRAREETARVAKKELASASSGLRALELIATIAPLLGLFGTVLGMIAAFQALQQAGSRADPAVLAGGIWEALLTTAAGMAVAIPASAALTWFESVIERIRLDVEDHATRIFVRSKPTELKIAAE